MTAELHRLPNGFRIAVEPVPGATSTALGIWVTAGGRHEADHETGIAHFLEHMAFKGTATRSARDIAETIEDVGGYLNAWTARDMTAYYARVLPDDVDLAMALLADILRAPAFDADEIEIERGVILQEIGQVADTPDDIIFDWLQEAAYPGQAIGRSLLGPAERVRGFTRADLTRFTASQYGANRMILAAAGAVDVDALLARATALFGDMAPAAAACTLPARFAGGERRCDRALEQAHIALAFPAPGYRDADFFAAQVATVALGGGMSSRLFQELREVRGLCYSVFAQAGACDDSGLMTLYAGTGGETVAGLATLAADEIRRAADDLSEAEIARARAQIKAGLLMGLESPSTRADRLARMAATWDRLIPLDDTVAAIEAVDAAAARAWLGGLCGPGGLAMALYGPVAGAPDLAALSARLAA
ncbi:MAG TPA: peptidase M16 [Rhodobacteraceae bacterium]|jgi:predicted Zn-dependent peptidase|nr:insulinase family protein [Paracoccaceae bacterium]HBG97834.1 peptidase M16 [Paracoccaceae bacterium]